MLIKYTLVVVLAIFSIATHSSDLTGISGRSEIYSIPTLTLTDKQFLLGDKNAKEVTLPLKNVPLNYMKK
jgi:hypothetical protein